MIAATVDKRFDLHLVVDNYGAPKTPAVKAWLAKHLRFHMHFTPTSASWLNLVECFFAEITREPIRRGVFTSVAALEGAIETYLAEQSAQTPRLDQTRIRRHRQNQPPPRSGCRHRQQVSSARLGILAAV
jgi:DDE superfamily endonuclease